MALSPCSCAIPDMWRNYLLSLSFANLVYIRAWSDLLPIGPEDLMYRKTLPGLGLYFAIAGDVLALSLLTFLLICLAPKLPRWVQPVLLVAAVAMVALALHAVSPKGFLHNGLFGFPALGVFCVGVAVLAFAFPARTFRVARGVALAAVPCLAITFLEPWFYVPFQSPLPPDPPLAQRLPGSPPVRVLWIIFDEWDQRLSFPDRALGIHLPVIDNLAARSFTATRALAAEGGMMPVSRMATTDALPILLYGKRIVDSGVEGAANRVIVFDDGTSTVFGGGNSIFAQVRALGWNSAVAGWYLPYCRDFGSQLTDCYWDVKYELRSSASPTVPGAAPALFEAAGNETRMLFETTMFSAFGPSLVLTRHASEYQVLLAAARRYAADPSIGLAFIHFNIPHAPYFYDPQVGRLGHYGYSETLYNSSLEWVDRSVGEILSSLSRAGLDSKTAIILSSDHPERNFTPDPYVPFIVHLPGRETGWVSVRPFPTIETANLVLAIARGEVKSSLEVEHFLTISSRHAR
jgi:hypothetical protein